VADGPHLRPIRWGLGNSQQEPRSIRGRVLTLPSGKGYFFLGARAGEFNLTYSNSNAGVCRPVADGPHLRLVTETGRSIAVGAPFDSGSGPGLSMFNLFCFFFPFKSCDLLDFQCRDTKTRGGWSAPAFIHFFITFGSRSPFDSGSGPEKLILNLFCFLFFSFQILRLARVKLQADGPHLRASRPS